MIVRETEQQFVMITQHEHAQFSRQIADCFKEELLVDQHYAEAVYLAIQEHDRSWIRLDDRPVWNDQDSIPFSFNDYPLLPKLVLYKLGLDEIEEMNDYAALLCSLHYSSFIHLRQSSLPDCAAFIDHEHARQQRLKPKLNHPGEYMIEQHFKLLKLCDELSLYVCLNEPGASKDEEHPWYREGFKTLINDQQIMARWISEINVQIRPFLFKKEFCASLKIKQVSKEAIHQLGVDRAYQETDWTVQEVTFEV
ncbi:DUF3891 family protein [Paenibacillus lutrae]|uniref:DUF3891 family protein n=1 Tax=Paenibacillus lutrae TaxID=2078573 RepID=A0A7X3FLB7_9BACL|nr:DUF3891 family protein [Paenibacillus lutrae]MVP01828.1 DUF3891 family protein [Paenibacillus lutrae]